MATKIDPAVQILLGLALGGAQGFLRRKKEKRDETREDERFALEKSNAEWTNKLREQQYNAAKKAYDDSVAAGRVYTPEEQAIVEESLAQLQLEGTRATTGVKQKELANYDEDRALDRESKQENMAYTRALRGQVGRGSGGGSGGGSDDPLRDPEYRKSSAAVTTQEKRVRMLENALDREDPGSPAHAQIKQQLNVEMTKLDSMYDGLQGGIGFEVLAEKRNKIAHPMAQVSAEKIKAAQARKDAEKRVKASPRYGERSFAEDFVSPFKATGKAIQNSFGGLMKFIDPRTAEDYIVAETGESVDVSDRDPEWIRKALEQKYIKPRYVNQATP